MVVFTYFCKVICVDASAQNRLSEFRRDYSTAFKSVTLICFLVHGPLFYSNAGAIKDFSLCGIVSYSSLSILMVFYQRDETSISNLKELLEHTQSKYYRVLY